MKESLSIGFKNGCITVIDGFEAYQQEVVVEKIRELEETKQKFLRGEKVNNNFSSVETYDKWIENWKNKNLYKCKCKCGREFFSSEDYILSKRHRYCGEICGMRLIREEKIIASYERIKHMSYDWKLLGKRHDTLDIYECTDDHVEGTPMPLRKGKMGAGSVYLYKNYKCRCILCGKEYIFRSDKFEIRKDYYGSKASWGYYSLACCDCHECSSFQWRTAKILLENSITFQPEYSFLDLYGNEGQNLLRFDFAIFDENASLKSLIECQGEQHTQPVKKFGGKYSYERQKKNDELKRQYVAGIGVPLIEIPHTCNTYEKEIDFLYKCNVIGDEKFL